MTPPNRPPLGGFERRLLGQLRELVELRAAPAPSQERLSSAASRRPLSRVRQRLVLTPRWALAPVAVAILACAVVLIGFSAGSSSPSPSLAKTFPAFAQPPTNVSGFLSGVLRNQGSAAAQVDASQARAITTPLGTGYVATDTQANLICIATPGFNGSGWGADCGTVSQAERDGVGASTVYDNSGHSVAWAELLPTGATATARDANGKTIPLSVTNGVLAVVVHHLTFITTTIAGHASTTALATQSECDPITQHGPDCKVLARFYAKQSAAHSAR